MSTSTSIMQVQSAPRSRFEQNLPFAAALLASKGFGQVGLRELAASMGMSCGALYHHIPSKEQLLYELIQSHYETLKLILLPVRSRRCRAKRRPLTECLIEVIEYCRASPAGFVLAVRDRHALSADLANKIQAARALLKNVLNDVAFGGGLPAQVGDIALACFESFPSWLETCGLDNQTAAHACSEMLLSLIHVPAPPRQVLLASR